MSGPDMNRSALSRLAILGFVTLVAVGGASFAVLHQESSVKAQFTPERMFPGLDDRLDKVTRITYTFGRGLDGVKKINLNRDQNGVWSLAERNNYPARIDKVKAALIGLGSLEAYDPRTSDPQWYAPLGLTAPEDLGRATRVEFFDASGRRMAGLLVGRVPDQTFDVKGEGLIYARRDGEKQSWLARGSLPLIAEEGGWLNPELSGFARDDVARVVLWAGTATPVKIGRANPSDKDFAIENLPAGTMGRGAPVLNGVVNAAVNLSLQDAVPVKNVNFPENSPRVEVEGFDGVRLSMVITGGSNSYWVKFLAAADPALLPAGADLKEATARASAINARLSPWAYQIPEDKGVQLTQVMDQLVHASVMPPMPDGAGMSATPPQGDTMPVPNESGEGGDMP